MKKTKRWPLTLTNAHFSKQMNSMPYEIMFRFCKKSMGSKKSAHAFFEKIIRCHRERKLNALQIKNFFLKNRYPDGNSLFDLAVRKIGSADNRKSLAFSEYLNLLDRLIDENILQPKDYLDSVLNREIPGGLSSLDKLLIQSNQLPALHVNYLRLYEKLYLFCLSRIDSSVDFLNHLNISIKYFNKQTHPFLIDYSLNLYFKLLNKLIEKNHNKQIAELKFDGLTFYLLTQKSLMSPTLEKSKICHYLDIINICEQRKENYTPRSLVSSNEIKSPYKMNTKNIHRLLTSTTVNPKQAIESKQVVKDGLKVFEHDILPQIGKMPGKHSYFSSNSRDLEERASPQVERLSNKTLAAQRRWG